MISLYSTLFVIGLCNYLTYKVSIGVRKEKDIFIEFDQRIIISWLIWLVPFGIIVASFFSTYVDWLITYVISAMCFIIVFYEAKCRNDSFETSGTSRTSNALKVIQLATLSVIIGFIFLSVSLLFIFVKIGSYN